MESLQSTPELPVVTRSRKDALDVWRATERLPAGPGILRWRARCQAADGPPAAVEIIQLAPGAGAGAIERFRAAARTLYTERAALSVIHLDAGGAVVRTAAPAAHLGDLGRLLRGGEVLSLAAWLGPACYLAGAALPGRLTPQEIAVDRGIPLLAFRGGPAPGDDAGPLPPELAAGAPPTRESGLYALGALLYRLAAGRWPAASEPAPPSSSAPDLGPAVDRLLLGLLSPTPADRRLALPPRPATPPRLDRRRLEDEQPTLSTPRESSALTAVLLVSPESLPPGVTRRVLHELALPPSAIAHFQQAGLPLPAGQFADLVDARRQADRLIEAGARAQVVTMDRLLRPAQLVWGAPLLALGGIAAGTGRLDVAAASGAVLVAALAAWVVSARRAQTRARRALEHLELEREMATA